MNAVGIDVSKGKSMVAALRPFGEVALLPRKFIHSAIGLEPLTLSILGQTLASPPCSTLGDRI